MSDKRSAQPRGGHLEEKPAALSYGAGSQLSCSEGAQECGAGGFLPAQVGDRPRKPIPEGATAAFSAMRANLSSLPVGTGKTLLQLLKDFISVQQLAPVRLIDPDVDPCSELIEVSFSCQRNIGASLMWSRLWRYPLRSSWRHPQRIE
jgi:hypothetical protein